MTHKIEVNNEKYLNVEPCQCPKAFSTDMKKNESRIDRRIKGWIKKFHSIQTNITVEPLIICYMLPSVVAGLAVQTLCMEKACLVNLKYDNVTCSHIMQGRTQNYSEAERQVQRMVTGMSAWSVPIQSAIPGLLVLFIGAWSDRTRNRKTFMVLPIFGKLVSICGVILSNYFFMDVGMNETALLEGLLPALSGGRIVLSMALYSYISDITSDMDRTFRVGIITAVLTLSRPVGLSLSGIMIRCLGYYGVFATATVFYLIGFTYILFRVKEKQDTKPKEEVSLLELFSVKDVVATVKVAVRTRSGSKRMEIFLVLFVYMLLVGPVLGEGNMTYWFTRYKFKFTEVDYSLFLTYSVLVGLVGSFVTIYLFSKRWKLNDSVIGGIACLSRILASLLYAMAPTRLVYFLGPILDMFSSAGATALRSIITKLVEADEIGKAGSLIGISEALIPIVYSPVYSKVYNTTLTHFPGAFYLISAALAVPAIFIFVIMYKLQTDIATEKEGALEEAVNKDNETTRF